MLYFTKINKMFFFKLFILKLFYNFEKKNDKNSQKYTTTQKSPNLATINNNHHTIH